MYKCVMCGFIWGPEDNTLEPVAECEYCDRDRRSAFREHKVWLKSRVRMQQEEEARSAGFLEDEEDTAQDEGEYHGLDRRERTKPGLTRNTQKVRGPR